MFFTDNGRETVEKLRGRYKQYAVTNGTAVAQNRKLAVSGLKELLDGVFISDEVGANKPDKEFFDRVFEKIGDYKKEEIVIIGDSLYSDIQGGNNAGIYSVLFDPGKNAVIPRIFMVDKFIFNLSETEKVIDELNNL